MRGSQQLFGRFVPVLLVAFTAFSACAKASPPDAVPAPILAATKVTEPAIVPIDDSQLLATPIASMPIADESRPYSTRELALKEAGYPTALWEGKIIYNAPAGQTGGARIIEHDLATGAETPLIDAQPPHTSAYSLRRSGDWLFYYETRQIVSVPPVFDPPRDYYAFNLKTRQRQHLPMLDGAVGPDLSGNAFGDDSFAYIRTSEGREQVRVYDLDIGEDRLLFETEDADTLLWSPLLHGDKVLVSQGWQTDWPPGITPTPIPGRPGPWPPRYRKTGDIFSLDIKTGERINLSDTGSASQPAIWGDYLMWIDQPIGGGQEYGSGEVYIRNTRTGETKKLTSDATYMHLYSSPRAGDGFFVWEDAHPGINKLPIYLPESDETVYLEEPGGKPVVYAGFTDGTTLFWLWSEEAALRNGAANGANGSRRKVYMTTFE